MTFLARARKCGRPGGSVAFEGVAPPAVGLPPAAKARPSFNSDANATVPNPIAHWLNKCRRVMRCRDEGVIGGGRSTSRSIADSYTAAGAPNTGLGRPQGH